MKGQFRGQTRERSSSEEEAEEQDDHVELHGSNPAMDDESAEEAPVFRVGFERHDPEVSQEGQGGGES